MLTLIGQLIVDGIAMGMVYVMLSAGIVFIMSVTGIFYLAYGQFYMIGAFLTWGAVVIFKLPFPVALAIAVIATTILGLLSYLLLFQHTMASEEKFLATIVAAVALMMVLGQGGLVVFGASPRSLPALFTGNISAFGINITVAKAMVVLIGVGVILLLFLFYTKTKTGRAMRAVSFLPETASLQGINTKAICLACVGIGTALAGFAGGIIAPGYGLVPEMGNNIILNVLLIAMLGGIDSMLGAVLGGLVVGLILSFGQYFFGARVQIILFITIGIIISIRPGGLLGRKELTL